MQIDTDIIIKSFSDFYTPAIFRDMNDRTERALAEIITDVFGGGYPFPERLARSYKIISRYLDRRWAAPLWRWLFYCGVQNMKTTARDYDTG